MWFDPQMWREAGISPPLGTLVVSPSGLSLWPPPRRSHPGSRGAEARAAFRSCRGSEWEEAMSFRKLPAVWAREARPEKITLLTQLLQDPRWSWRAEMCAAAGGRSDRADTSAILGEPQGRRYWEPLRTSVNLKLKVGPTGSTYFSQRYFSRNAFPRGHEVYQPFLFFEM